MNRKIEKANDVLQDRTKELRGTIPTTGGQLNTADALQTITDDLEVDFGEVCEFAETVYRQARFAIQAGGEIPTKRVWEGTIGYVLLVGVMVGRLEDEA